MEENQILTEYTTRNQTVEEVETQQPVVTEEEKTLPQSKVNEIVQKRIEKVNEQWQKKFDALQESIKLQSMNEEQKAEYDYNKKLEELQQREQELENKINAYNQQQYKTTIQTQLSEAGLPTTMADMLVNMDAEAVATQINAMKDMFSSQINQQVQAKVKASANVPTQPLEQSKPLTMEDIARMTPQEIMKRKSEVDQAIKDYYKTK